MRPPVTTPRRWFRTIRRAARAILRTRRDSLWLLMMRWRAENALAALGALSEVRRDAAAMRTFRVALARIGRTVAAPARRVAALHFVYGLAKAGDLPFHVLVAIVSAQRWHPEARTFLYCRHEPAGPFWAVLRGRVEIVPVPDFAWFGIARVAHYAHQADIIRLLALQEIGGLYLDCDTITIASMDDLAVHPFVMGVQASIPGAAGGLCNAIMMGRRGSRFAAIWLSRYGSFRSRGHDRHWDFHSVRLPVYLYSRAPGLLHVLPHDAWFFPLWPSIRRVLLAPGSAESNRSLLEGQRAIHLWHTMIGGALDAWGPQNVHDDTLLAALSREAFSGLPEGERRAIEEPLGLRRPEANPTPGRPQRRQAAVRETASDA